VAVNWADMHISEVDRARFFVSSLSYHIVVAGDGQLKDVQLDSKSKDPASTTGT
jgi:hypothetical protein